MAVPDRRRRIQLNLIWVLSCFLNCFPFDKRDFALTSIILLLIVYLDGSIKYGREWSSPELHFIFDEINGDNI